MATFLLREDLRFSERGEGSAPEALSGGLVVLLSDHIEPSACFFLAWLVFDFDSPPFFDGANVPTRTLVAASSQAEKGKQRQKERESTTSPATTSNNLAGIRRLTLAEPTALGQLG
jgi:hypothetical protein